MMIILASIIGTTFISGILGMGGGVILIGVLSLLLPVTSAMVLHGVTQLFSNGFRSYLLKDNIQMKVILPYFGGALLGYFIFSMFSFVPSKSFILISLGIFPFIALFLTRSISLNITYSPNAILCGLIVTMTQILAGASGPVLDIFYVKSELNRHQIIATKAFTQAIGHSFKLLYYTQILVLHQASELEFSLWLLPLAVACAFLGTRLGKSVLDAISELQFQKYSRLVILLIGGLYFIKGVMAAL